MTWQRRARIVVAIVGLGCAAAVYFLARPRQAAVVAPVPTAPDREAKYQSGAGKYFHHDKDGKRVLELSYEKASEYSDGRGLYEKVHAKFVQGHEIFADRVETKSPPADGEMPDPNTPGGVEQMRQIAEARAQFQGIAVQNLRNRYEEGELPVDFRINVNPMVIWIWIGGATGVIGGLLAAWPAAAARRSRVSDVHAARLARDLGRA